jgi:hypothetical protein
MRSAADNGSRWELLSAAASSCCGASGACRRTLACHAALPLNIRTVRTINSNCQASCMLQSIHSTKTTDFARVVWCVLRVLWPADLQMVNMSLRFLSKPAEERLTKIFQVRLLEAQQHRRTFSIPARDKPSVLPVLPASKHLQCECMATLSLACQQ